jgi:hypothetical protein
VYRGDSDFERAIGPYRAKTDSVIFVHGRPMPIKLVERIIVARLAEIETVGKAG